MSRKLIIIIVGLFILQFGLFTLIEQEIKPEEVAKQQKEDFEYNYNVYLDVNGQPVNNELNLDNRGLADIPTAIYSFTRLEKIDLSRNNLTEFPYELLKLPNLKSINLSRNKIKKIDFSEIKNSQLEYLDLYNNQIIVVENLENLTALRSVDLSGNKLTRIPNITSDALNYAYFNVNKIKILDGKIGKNLINLNLEDNKIDSINLDLSGVEMLSGLNLSKNYTLNSFPYVALDLPNLGDLVLVDCNISTISKKLLNSAKNLYKLDLQDNKLSEFIIDSTTFSGLTLLNLSNNSLKKVEIVNHSIETLYLESNELRYENLVLRMNSLSELLLTDNQLTALPNTAVNAPKLIYLNIYNNEINTNQENEILSRLIK